VDFGGSTLQKSASFPNAHLLQANAKNLIIRNIILDGNRGPDDVQTLSITGGTPVSGNVTLTFGGATTSSIPYNANAQQVQAALAALSGATPALTWQNVQVTGGPWPTTAMTVKFISNNGSTAQSLIALATNTFDTGTVTITHTTTGSNNNQILTSYLLNFTTSASETICDNVQANNNRAIGFRNAGGIVSLYRCKADNNNASAAGNGAGNTNGIGFYTDTGGTSRLYDCTASNNAYRGYLWTGGTNGEGNIVSNCRGHRNTYSGMLIGAGTGTVISYYDFDAGAAPFEMAGVSDWETGIVVAEKAGFTSTLPSATSITITGCTRCKFGTLISRAQNGYGVVIGPNPDFSSNPSTYNQFGTIMVDGFGSSNTSDPAVNLNGGSQFNTISTIIASNVSIAVSIGEGFYPYNTENNVINNLLVNNTYYPAVYVVGGFNNRINNAVLRNVGKSSAVSAGNPVGPGGSGSVARRSGLFSFVSLNTTGNVSGSSLTNLDNWNGFTQGMPVKITGAGPASADLYTTIASLTDTTITLTDAASTLANGTPVQGQATTCNTSNGSNQLTSVATTTRFTIDMPVRVAGAGPGGSELISKITNIAGTTFTIADNVSATLTATQLTGVISANNIIGNVEHTNSGTATYTVKTNGIGTPQTIANIEEVLYCDAASLGNQVQNVSHVDTATGIAEDHATVVSDNRVFFGQKDYRTVTTTYAIIPTDNIILADATSAGFTVTLPSAIGLAGAKFTIKRINSNANNVTIATTSAQTIDGATTQVLTMPFSSFDLVGDGTNWQII
jgi:hypothetical protein